MDIHSIATRLFYDPLFRSDALKIPDEMDRMRATHQNIPARIITSKSWHLIPYLTLDEMNYADEDGITLLMHTINARQIFFVRYLCRAPVLINTWDWTGFTPLYFAARTGDLNIFRAVLEAGAKIETACVRGNSVVHCAAYVGSVPILQCLSEMGADLNRTDNWMGIPPIQYAVERGHLDVVQFLIPYHLPDYRDHVGRNLTLIALSAHQLEIYDYLVRMGHEPSFLNYKVSPFRSCGWAIKDPEIMTHLLDRYGSPLLDPDQDRACKCRQPLHIYEPGICPTLLDHTLKVRSDSTQILLSRGIGYRYT
jgi:ankyrin repeat protein